jgi:hypothetical protein
MSAQASMDQSFDAYWLAYLRAHRSPANRLLHVLGTSIGLVGGLGAAIIVVWWAFVPVAMLGYAMALAGHLLFERNLPFASRPLLGLIADFRMIILFARGRLDGEVARATSNL